MNQSAISNYQLAKKGFTLIELLISMALLGVIFSAVATIFTSAVKNYETNSQKSLLQKDLNFAIDSIGNNIKEAVLVPQSQDTFSLSENTLIIALPAKDTNGNFIYSAGVIEKDYFIYYLSDNNLRKKIYANALGSRMDQNGHDTILISNVSTLNYTYLPNSTEATQVKVDLSLEKAVGKRTVSISGAKTANIRNRP